MFTLVPHKDGYAILKDTGEIHETFYANEYHEAEETLRGLNELCKFTVTFLKARGAWRTIRGKRRFMPLEEFYSCSKTVSASSEIEAVNVIIREYCDRFILRDITPHLYNS